MNMTHFIQNEITHSEAQRCLIELERQNPSSTHMVVNFDTYEGKYKLPISITYTVTGRKGGLHADNAIRLLKKRILELELTQLLCKRLNPPSQLTGHPHAESMRLYAEDAAKTPEPWLLWESRIAEAKAEPWVPHRTHPLWLTKQQYRRKHVSALTELNAILQGYRDKLAIYTEADKVSPGYDFLIVQIEEIKLAIEVVEKHQLPDPISINDVKNVTCNNYHQAGTEEEDASIKPGDFICVKNDHVVSQHNTTLIDAWILRKFVRFNTYDQAGTVVKDGDPIHYWDHYTTLDKLTDNDVLMLDMITEHYNVELLEAYREFMDKRNKKCKAS